MNNDDLNVERRLILAFVLSALVFLAFLPFMQKRAAVPAEHTVAGTASPAAAPPAATPPAPLPAPLARRNPARKAAPVTAVAETVATVDTPVFHIVLSNRGATARSWVLKQYIDEESRPLELVAPKFGAEHSYPLSFWTPDQNLNAALNQALYRVTESHPDSVTTVVNFAWSNGTVAASKTLTFDQGYVVQVAAAVTRDGSPVPDVALAWPGNFGDRTVYNHYSTQEVFFETANRLSTLKVKKVANQQVSTADYQFAGVEDQYFAVAFLPAEPGPRALTTFNVVYTPSGKNAKPEATVGLALAGGDFRLFVGPKKIDLLRSIDPRLRSLVDFGWFSFFADPLFVWMNWTYDHWIRNYGWVILFITAVIMVAMFPFRWKAQKSQIKMAALQPKVNALNAKMKKYPLRDPRRQEVQQEIMRVYQEHGVNPLGGCLPMLVQLPLIYGFYEVLENAIELRHAPWIGYIHDLSAKDPYYILPIVLIISQFWTMALTPMMPGQDPKQARMMKYVFPLFLGYIFFFLPSGVNLYYLASNLIGAGQQVLINKRFGYAPGGTQAGGKASAAAGRGKVAGAAAKAKVRQKA